MVSFVDKMGPTLTEVISCLRKKKFGKKMNPQIQMLLNKYFGPQFATKTKRIAVGLAEDFWKDGTENPFGVRSPHLKKPSPDISQPNPFMHSTVEQSSTVKPSDVSITNPSRELAGKLWHAEPGEISEKMWGNGFVTPGDSEITELLVMPLALNKELSVLDLSAGLGGRLRRTTEEFGVYVTGLEPDPQIAARGMELSIRAGKAKHAAISAYDPANFSVTRRYDCIISRETFYRVADRKKFFLELANCTKPGAQISFTDYIVNSEFRENPAVKKWIESEKGANPPSLVELAQEWAKAGFDLRIHDDQTEFYKKEVAGGMKRMASFLASGPRPDEETKLALRRRIDTWAQRLSALENGMKFYRFYGKKP